jgi:hypothetical protein
MAAVEIFEVQEDDDFVSTPYLRLVGAPSPAPSLHYGPSLARRRAARARMVQRRRRSLAVLVFAAALGVLAIPGHVFGATTGAGLSTDLAGSSVLASGMVYVVQSGDTVSSIARDINPVDPTLARAMLVHELKSSVVVPGEHVLIP